MVVLAVLVFAGVLLLVVAPKYQLTAPQAVALAAGLFVVRAGGVSVGRYILGHTGGPMQLLAYLLVMLGWPEIAIPGTLGWTANRDHSLIMATALLAATSVVVGFVVYVRRSPPAPR